MRENTFDVPAYKFFILKINDGLKMHSYSYYQSLISRGFQGKHTLIPFENIDGLEVGEMRNLIKISEILILGATYYEECTNNCYIHNLANINTLYFSSECLDDKKNLTIDKICEERMEQEYLRSDDYTKKCIDAFLKDIKMVVIRRLKRELND